MYKTIVVLILLFFLTVAGNDILEPKLPDISELTKPIEIYYPEYTFIELGAGTSRDFILYASSLDGLSLFKTFSLFGEDKRRFIEIDYKRHNFKTLKSLISYSIYISHSSDSLSSSRIIPEINHSINLYNGNLNTTFSFVYFPEKELINNLSKVFYINHSNDFDWGIISNWQRTDNPENSYLGIFLEKENIRYGLFYSKSIFPFLLIKPEFNSNLKFELYVDAERRCVIDAENIFSDILLQQEYQNVRSYYLGLLSVKYYSFQIKAKIYSDIDNIQSYSDISSPFYEFTLSKSGKLKNVFCDVEFSFEEKEFSKFSSMKIFSFYEFKDARFCTSYKVFRHNSSFSNIISPSVSLGSNSKRIVFGIKNIMSQYDFEELLYSPVKTYFLNFIFIQASLFGNLKQ
ncbi:MAG: hypothetical protein COX48_05775 [bacterium (Candidatus Stahlbacteria) CG23_combo_of_CG06-09_8_20_14_all_34_7]|nr:MAG: hypothetical protein COX48_05775 [bacterium (Candidatus Stahlbacteria) CG23_combo_of_CG06-09_8_20_14_all_34_7]